MPAEFVALDLACGPGAISQRLLKRFPQARCIAVDLDPFLLTIGRQTLGDMDGRLRWVEVDLNTPAWIEALGVTQVDAVLSTTALHWLRNDVLARVYHQLAQLLRPGGVFLNGDHMKFAAHLETFNQIVATLKTKRYEVAFTQQGIEDWEQWWAAAQAEPAFAELLAERERRFAQRTRDWGKAGYDFHQALYTRRGSAKSILFGSTLTIVSLWQCDNAENAAHFWTHCPDGLRTKFPGLVLSIAVLPASISTSSSFVELRRAISSYIWRRFWLTSLTKAWTSAGAPGCTMPR